MTPPLRIEQPRKASVQWPSPASTNTSFRRRVLIFVGLLWATLVFLIALNTNSDYEYGIDAVGFITAFTVFGLLPIGIVLGVMWIRAAKRQ